MSREIKFRVWSEEEKEYRKDCLLLKLFDCVTGLFATIFNNEGDRFDIEQYTGLKDKNGKEIYEGDIVRVYDRFVSAITWQDDYCGFRWYDNSGDGYCGLGKDSEEYYEVIGNIHENAELLEDK